MTSSADAPVTAPPTSGRFPGWWVVTGCFIVLTTTSGLGFYGLAVYLNAFSKEQGWPLSTISLATTVFFIVGGAVGVWIGSIIARVDVRSVIVGGGLIGGASLAVLGQVDEQWELFAVYAVFAVGFAAAGLVPMTTVVTRWFHARRSVALSIASTGLSVGGILITPVAKGLLDSRGLSAGTPWLGVLFVIGVVPVTLLLVKPDPEPLGWAPDGVRRAAGESAPPLTGTPFAEAVRSRFFIAVTIGYIFALGSQVGGIQQLVKLVEDRTTPETAQFAITVLAATSVVARLIGGRVVQLVPMMGFCVTLAVLQSVALGLLGFAEARWLIFVAIIIFGATVGNILMLQPLLIAERFGVRDYPRIFGRSQFVAVVGTAGGPLLIGWLFDVAGSYRIPYLAAAGCALVGALILAQGGPATVPADEH